MDGGYTSVYGLVPVHLLVAGVGGVTRVTRPSETVSR